MNSSSCKKSSSLIKKMALASLGIALVLLPPVIELILILYFLFNFQSICPMSFNAFPRPKLISTPECPPNKPEIKIFIGIRFSSFFTSSL